jgi:hypothetical protein
MTKKNISHRVEGTLGSSSASYNADRSLNSHLVRASPKAEVYSFPGLDTNKVVHEVAVEQNPQPDIGEEMLPMEFIDEILED